MIYRYDDPRCASAMRESHGALIGLPVGFRLD